jgi:hypothetical protein
VAKLNTPHTVTRDVPRTHEGAPAKRITLTQELRRSVLACLLWEDQFYESGVAIAERIAELVPKVPSADVASLAVEARTVQYLRHVPLLLCRELARHGTLQADTLAAVIGRADELAEFVALYWKDGKEPLSKQVKVGLARAFPKFDAYQLAKYDRDGAVRLRDVLFLCHPKPKDEAQAAVWKGLVDGKLPVPGTWENELSAGKNKTEVWTRLLAEGKLGGLALLRNLRNMAQATVPRHLVTAALEAHPFKRVLPFRFVAAAKAAPAFESALDAAMLRVLQSQTKLPGKTLAVIDVSGSMYGRAVSSRSDLDRAFAAATLGAVLREVCEEIAVYATAGDDYARRHATAMVPARHGMALVDAIHGQCQPLGGGGIFLTPVCRWLAERERDVDRMVVITDEADCAIDPKDSPNHAKPLGRRNYLINVGSYRRGIGYGVWTHIDGWSEAIVRYIQESERNATTN